MTAEQNVANASCSRRVLALVGVAIVAGTLYAQTLTDGKITHLEPPQIQSLKSNLGSFHNGPDDYYAINIDDKKMSPLQFPKDTPPKLEGWDRDPVTTSKLGKKLEWHRFSQTVNKKSPSFKKVLMAQFSSNDKDFDLYMETRRINFQYAQRWNQDIVFFNATGVNRKDANLATLLQLGWELRDQYDQLLILDADAMMNRFRLDITKLMETPMDMLVAKRDKSVKLTRTYKVRSGATLWNLKHLLIPTVLQNWQEVIRKGRSKDQKTFLSRALFSYASEIRSVNAEISNADDAQVRVMEWKDKTDAKARRKRMQKAAQKTCKKYKLNCKL